MPDHRRPARHRRPRLRLAVAAAVLLSLAACGGSDDGDAAEESPGTEQDGTTTTTTTTTTEDDGTTTTAPEDDETADDGDDSATTGGDACDIVSDEVVTQVLGMADIPRREANGVVGETYSCIKGSERTDDLTTASYVSVAFIPGGSAIVDQFAGEAGSVDVPGLGDQAVFVPSAGSLSIAEGSDSYQIQVVKLGRPSNQADAVAVAEDVLGG